MVISILHSIIWTVVVDCKDTDVFIILLVKYLRFKTQYKTLMQKNNNDFININSIAEALQSKGIKLVSLALLHALSGCDTVSYPYGIGRTTAWNIYKSTSHTS